MGAEDLFFSSNNRSCHNAVPDFQRCFRRISQPLHNTFLDDNPVYHHFNAVFLILFQLNRIIQRIQCSVRPNTDISFLSKLFQKLLMCSLFLGNYRSEKHQLCSLRQSQKRINNLINRLLSNRLSAVRTISPACMGIKHTEVVMNFRHCSHRGAGIMTGGFLIDRYGRRQTGNLIHLRLIHLSQKLPGIGRQRFHIFPLPLCIDRIKCQ